MREALLGATVVVPHTDADGLAAGALALRARAEPADAALLLERGRTPWSEALPAGRVAILDWGMRALDPPALIVDDHAAEGEPADGQLLLSGFGEGRETTTAALVRRLVPEQPAWLAAVGASATWARRLCAARVRGRSANDGAETRTARQRTAPCPLAPALGARGTPRAPRLTPTPSFFEELARRRYRRHENKLVRQERWGLPEGGLSSTLNRAEMHNAQRTQNRSLFWLEVVVAADRAQDCKTLAAAVQARRGENRLHRRWMHVRQNLYRRRFPHALAPPLPSLRSLVSAAEAAHLLALPSARMKGVPVRRLTLPRIPAPPEAMRATDLEPVPAAPDRAAAPRHAGPTRS